MRNFVSTILLNKNIIIKRQMLCMVCLSFVSFMLLGGIAKADGDYGADREKVDRQQVNSAASLIEDAKPEDVARAIGHYGRARSYLIKAIQEFDMGYKVAKVDSLLDAKNWRTTVVNRAEELERVLSPQPKVTKKGVKYEGDSRLLRNDQLDKGTVKK